mmetsp:Transcript_99115/g.182166  ORF Transcript_99115/g.182166 Transcript_99115/m.182166 type:complete len:309 (-) Transcript_99115:246-1172(-)
MCLLGLPLLALLDECLGYAGDFRTQGFGGVFTVHCALSLHLILSMRSATSSNGKFPPKCLRLLLECSHISSLITWSCISTSLRHCILCKFIVKIQIPSVDTSVWRTGGCCGSCILSCLLNVSSCEGLAFCLQALNVTLQLPCSRLCSLQGLLQALHLATSLRRTLLLLGETLPRLLQRLRGPAGLLLSRQCFACVWRCWCSRRRRGRGMFLIKVKIGPSIFITFGSLASSACPGIFLLDGGYFLCLQPSNLCASATELLLSHAQRFPRTCTLAARFGQGLLTLCSPLPHFLRALRVSCQGCCCWCWCC